MTGSMMDGAAGLWDSPTEHVQMQHGKATRFHVRKLYGRLHQELASHMEAGNSQVAVALIRGRQSEVNDVDETGASLLMIACHWGDELVVKTLLEHAAKVDAEDNDSWTPLMYACRDGQVQATVQLLESGASLEKRDLGGWTALMWACYKGRTSCVDELIKREVNVNIKAMYNMTCLHWTAGRGHMECTEMLLRAGAKVDATDKYGSTPLIWASRKGHLPIVESLLHHGASADAVGMYSWTPLLVALQGGHVHVAQILLETHPNLNATNQAGLTALALAAKGGYSDIVVELLNQGAYLNIADKNGDTVLHHAVKGGHVEIVKMLLRKNPDIDVKGQDDKTVLYTAADKGNTAVVKLLLSADPDKELSDKDGNTPLLRAVRNRNCEIAFLLIEKGAKVSAADMKGDTCLHIAMRARNRRMLELLLKNPSNSRYLYMRNECGETPYSIDGTNKRSILSHIFGSRSLNSQVAVESQLGYELYSSSLADILSSPRLNTPMTVGLFAKWGSGKSFMLNKLKEDMQAYMKQSPLVYFEFSWLVFFINCVLAAVVALFVVGLTKSWEASLSTGAGTLVFCYILQAMLYCLDRKKRWRWVAHISNTLATQLQKFRLVLYMFFYNRPPPRDDDFTSNSISFVFAESTKLTSLGGEQSLASMIGSLFDALEKRYGVLVTRLYKVFGSDKEESGRFKKLCCIPYFVIFLLVLGCLVTATGLALIHLPAEDGYQPEHIIALAVAGVVGIFLLLSLHNIARAIAVYCHSPKRRTNQASKSLNSSKSDNFMHVLKKEVELLSSLVTTMDRHEEWQTRLVLIVDGLDSCEQDKVLQVLDAINLIIPENSPFIVLLAVDPHVIIKGIEANQLQALRDQSLNGYGYLRNIVHLPFYLQNHGLPRMYTANESAHFRRWQNLPPRRKSVQLQQEVSVVSSIASLDFSQRGSQKSKNTAVVDSMFMMEPLHQFIGEMPKNIMKNDYFVDINPRSMRRLMNIIAMAGRLLRANDIEFNWYRLSAWINITEQWPYRTSWILLYYEEMEGKLEDSLSLMSIYDLIKERIPVVREAEPLLDIDRNEKKFVAFLKSHSPKMSVDDIKKFMPATINLDPFLRKLIKEKARDTAEMVVPDSVVPTNNRVATYQKNQRIVSSPPSKYGNHVGSLYPVGMNPLAAPSSFISSLHKQKLPKDIKPLSRNTVSDICELLHKIKGMSPLHIDEYKAAILLHNVNGLVLSDCNMPELRPILDMKFGDWQLFQLTILAMRETDTTSLASSSSEEIITERSPRAPLTKIPSADEGFEANLSANCATEPPFSISPNSSKKSFASPPGVGRRPRADTSLDMVLLENQMIIGALQNQVLSSDEEESSDDEQQDTVTDSMKTTEATDTKNVKFEIIDESSSGVNPLIHSRDVPQLSRSATELRSYRKQTL